MSRGPGGWTKEQTDHGNKIVEVDFFEEVRRETKPGGGIPPFRKFKVWIDTKVRSILQSSLFSDLYKVDPTTISKVCSTITRALADTYV